MAEKPEDQFSSEEKIAKAKELYARGCRNYYVKSYSEAADDLGEAAKLYGEEYGVDGDELGEVYLLYAKALVAIGQEENKLIDVPEEEEDDEEEEGEDEPELAVEPEEIENGTEKPETNGTENGEKTNGHSEEPTAGPSGTADNESSNDAAETENEGDDDGSNLELAWEVLQNAALIFERQGMKGLNNLLDVYVDMAGISLENGNFEVAIKDFMRALDIFLDLEEADRNKRIEAEIHYKIGLCQTMTKQYDESVKSFQSAADLIEEVIAIEKAIEPQTAEMALKVKDLEETLQEILNKITEIGDTKAEEIEQVKKEMAKLFGVAPGASESSNGAGSSSSSLSVQAPSNAAKSPEAEKPKPTDISHLIKRKKTDNDSVGASPAKKQAVEIASGEKIAVDVTVTEKAEVSEETSAVPVIDN